MKYCIIFCLSIVCFYACKNESPQKQKRILFVGNSLTYYHDMPKLLQQMFNEKQLNFTIEQSTYAGFSLDSHLNAMIIGREDNYDKIYTRPKKYGEVSRTAEKIQNNQYDYIVLQSKSGSIVIPEFVKSDLANTVSAFRGLIDTTKTELLLFQNFPMNRPYPRSACKLIQTTKIKSCSVEINDLETEMSEIKKGSMQVGLPIIPIGEQYYKLRKTNDTLTLYDDDIHPSVNGAYLSALTCFEYFSELSAGSVKFSGAVKPNVAELLKEQF